MAVHTRGFDRRGFFRPASVYRPTQEAAWQQTAQTPTGHWTGDAFVKLASAVGLGRQGAARARAEDAAAADYARMQAANRQMAVDLGFNEAQVNYVGSLPTDEAFELLSKRWDDQTRKQREDAEKAQERADAVSLRRGQRSGLSASLGVSMPEVARLQREGMSPAQIREHYEAPEPPKFQKAKLPDGSIGYFDPATGETTMTHRAPSVEGLTPEVMARAAELYGDNLGTILQAGGKSDVLKAVRASMGAGPAAKPPKPPTEAAIKLGNVAAGIKRGLSTLLQPMEDGKPLFNVWARPGPNLAAMALPRSMENVILGRDAEIARSTMEQDVVEPLLRLASGAATPDPEVERYIRNLSPAWGDNPETIQFKIDRLNALAENTDILARGGSLADVMNATDRWVSGRDVRSRVLGGQSMAPPPIPTGDRDLASWILGDQ